MGVRVYQLQVPAAASCLRPVRAFLTAVLEDVLGAATPAVVLALDEACANVVAHRARHLGRDEVELRVEVAPALVRFRLAAFCAAADLPAIRPRDLAEVRPGGLGTHFVGQIMDRVDYEPDPQCPGAMALVLEKRVLPEGVP
jgi:sigma-B regulation protein RsbU (phosphoserine phosphatase)